MFIRTKYLLTYYFCLVCWLFGFEFLQAQVLPFSHYTTKDGLLSNVVNCLYQDSRGFIWIGTGEGLSKFDGRTFTNYTPANGYPFSSVSDIIEDRSSPGTMLIATLGSGLVKMKERSFTRITIDSSELSVSIGRVLQDSKQRIWCTVGKYIYIIENESAKRFRPDILFGNIYDIIFESDSVLWVSEFKKVHRISLFTGSYQCTNLPVDSKVLPFTTCLFIDSESSLWIGISDGNVYQLKHDRLEKRLHHVSGVISDINEDEDGNIWVCSFDGIHRIKKSLGTESNVLKITKENGLNQDAVTYMLIDRESNFWFGYGTEGFSKLADLHLVSFKHGGIPPTPNNTITNVDKNDHIWICTFSSLLEFWQMPSGEWKQQSHLIGTIYGKSHPISVMFDSEDRCWVLYSNSVFRRFEVKGNDDGASVLRETKNIDMQKKYSAGLPFFFIIDTNDILWFVDVAHGVYVLNPEQPEPLIRLITPNDGLPGISFRTLYQDRSGTMWFGGNNEGLASLSKTNFLTGKLHLYTMKDGLSSDAIRSLLQDRTGNLWIGTRYNGLTIMENEMFTNIDMRTGLLSNTIWRIAQDSSGRLWFGTPTGLVYLENEEAREFKAFERQHLDGQISTLGVMHNGLIWCTTADWLTIFDPHDKQTKVQFPPIYLTHCSVNGISVQIQSELSLSHNENNIVLEFIGISFRDEQALRYQYRLIGTEHQWHPPTSENSITYGSLQPGEYTFEVRAVTGDGVISEVPARLSFTIASPFWKVWWFILIVNVLIIGLFAIVYFYRVRQVLKVERMRTRIATDLHDDIGSTLSSISIFSEMVRREIEQVAPKSSHILHRIGESSRSMLDAMDDIVWTINPGNDRLENLALRIREFATEMFEASNYSFDINIPEKLSNIKLPMETRKNIFLIAKEAVNNIVRHSLCTHASVLMREQGGELELLLQDNGVGIPKEILSSSNGLKNLERRAKEIGGTLSVASTENKGTLISLRVKIT